MTFCKLGEFPRRLCQQVMEAGVSQGRALFDHLIWTLLGSQPQKRYGEAPEVDLPGGLLPGRKSKWTGEGERPLGFDEQTIPTRSRAADRGGWGPENYCLRFRERLQNDSSSQNWFTMRTLSHVFLLQASLGSSCCRAGRDAPEPTGLSSAQPRG